MSQKVRSQFFSFLFPAIGFLLLLTYVILGYFTWPAADDLCAGAFVTDHGFWNTQLALFQEMNARFVSTFFITLFTSNGIILYKVGIIFVILVFSLSIFVFTSKLTLGIRQTIVIALIWMLVWLNMIPDIAEVMYWLSGSVSYTFSAAVLLLFFAVCISLFSSKRSAPGTYILIGLLAILVAGAHELLVVIAISTLIYILLFVKLSSSVRKKLMWILIVFAACFFLIVFSGSNVNRMNFYEKISIAQNIKTSMLAFLKLFTLLFSDPLFLITAVACMVGGDKIFVKVKIQESKSIHLIISTIYILFSFLIFISIPVFATGMMPSLRVYSLLTIFFVPVLFMTFFRIKMFFFPSVHLSVIQYKMSKAFFFSIFLILLCTGFHKIPGDRFIFTGNQSLVIHDLYSDAFHYDKEMQKRYSIIIESQATQNDTITLTLPEHQPKSLYFLDIGTDQTNWKSLCFKEFYGIDAEMVVIGN